MSCWFGLALKYIGGRQTGAGHFVWEYLYRLVDLEFGQIGSLRRRVINNGGFAANSLSLRSHAFL